MHGNTKRPPNLSVVLVEQLFSRLLKRFGPQRWWPAETDWEMMVGAILTQNTSWTNVEKALAALKQSKTLSVQAIATMPRRRLERLIRPSGYFRQKAKRLQLLAREMRKAPAFFRQLCGERRPLTPRVSPNPSWGIRSTLSRYRERGRPTAGSAAGEGIQALRQRLLSLHGIGPETADSILLYAGRYPVFVVDAYTRRMGQRIGLFKTDDYNKIQSFFQQALKQRSAQLARHLATVSTYNEFHALIVALAKNICTSRQPTCPECPVSAVCAFAKATRSPH
jgi:endonuclease-3 related protein